jgi:uncharacterized protein
MATRQEQLNAILQRLSASLGADMKGAVAVSMDGIVLAALLSTTASPDRVGAVAATIVGVSRRVATELSIGRPEETILKANDGLFMVLPAGDQSLLAVNIAQQANLGMVRIEAREAASEIAKIV